MTENPGTSSTRYIRFDILQRLEHAAFLLSFTTLGFTGLPQKFPLSPISIGIFSLLGGIEHARMIHHTAAVVMMIVSVIHVLEVLYRILVLRTPVSMIPWITDIRHVLEDIGYYLGLRKHRAYYGRYSYAEKMEYLALIWGTIVMALTGFMMWNPISTVRFLPGEAIPAAKVAHGSEAILAVLAIIIWHFYQVHIRHFNKSMFTGIMSRAEMEHEHPAELAAIESARPVEPISPAVLRRRQMIYLPIALVILSISSYGLYLFVTYETTAISTVPQAETVEVFVPFTPTPTWTPTPVPTATPTPLPTSTPEATAEQAVEAATETAPAPASNLTWTNDIGPMLQAKCGACHGENSFTGLSYDTYANLMKGGKSGVVVVPGDSAGSTIVKIQSAGGHPGMLSPEELAKLIEWIDAGAGE